MIIRQALIFTRSLLWELLQKLNYWKLWHVRKAVRLVHKGGYKLSSKPHLSPQKLSIWPPFGTVLTGGMHKYTFSKWALFASTDCSWYLLYSMMHQYFFWIHKSFTFLLCDSLQSKDGRYFSSLSSGIFTVMLWLDKAAWVIDSLKPSFCSQTTYPLNGFRNTHN